MAEPVIIGNATLYCGDCLEILPMLCKVDAVVTDPPYGVGVDYDTYDDTPENFRKTINAVIPMCRALAKFVVMPVGDRTALRQIYIDHDPGWLISWHKGSPGTRSPIGFNSWEPHVCWGRPTNAMHDAFSTRCGFEDDRHPCPKPIAYSNWLCSRAADYGETIADPFMGSGTTGVACMTLGRKFIGIELSPKYFDIACERIDQAQRQQRLFA